MADTEQDGTAGPGGVGCREVARPHSLAQLCALAELG